MTIFKLLIFRCSKETNSSCNEDDSKLDTEFFNQFYFEVHHVSYQLDFTKYGQSPTKVTDTTERFLQLSTSTIKSYHFHLRKNTIETSDSFIQIGFTNEYTYYDIGRRT